MPSQKLSRLDLYRVHRDQVGTKDELIYHRTYWLLTTQTILFAAYTLALVSAYSGITLKPSKLLVELIDPDAWDTARLSLIHSLVKFTAVLGLLVSL